MFHELGEAERVLAGVVLRPLWSSFFKKFCVAQAAQLRISECMGALLCKKF
jgi:hypothetical protein